MDDWPSSDEFYQVVEPLRHGDFKIPQGRKVQTMEVKNIRSVHPDDLNDLLLEGVNFFGPDSSLTANFPGGTVELFSESPDRRPFSLPGGSQVSIECGDLSYDWRSW